MRQPTRGHGTVILSLLILGLVLPAIAQALPLLTWAPPAEYESYTRFVIPASGGTITLPSSNTDYYLVAPNIITGEVNLRGGRNVVWIGGQINISNKSEYASAISRRALVLSDSPNGSSVNGRNIHIEGLLINGNDLSEGIDTNCPTAVVTLQNIHVSAVKIRGCDDRDATGGYTSASHPDIVQTWGSHNGLRIDGLTGASNYQGIFLKEDVANARHAPVFLRNVNLKAISLPDEADSRYAHAGHRMLTVHKDRTGQVFIDNGTVWIQHHPDSGWANGFHRSVYRDETGKLIPDPVAGNAPFTTAFGGGHPATAQLARDALGQYVYWEDWYTDGQPAIRNWDDSGFGTIYSGSPTVDFVPYESVGLNYVSPGYLPEPAAMALLGLCGITLLMRRRANSQLKTGIAPAGVRTFSHGQER